MPQPNGKCGIVWEGSFFVYHSLALVNRELVLALLRDEQLEIGIKPYEPDQFDETVDPRFALLSARMNLRPARVDFTVRHRWPPLFEPAEGRLIWIQPWEYGSLPVEWARFAATDQVAEIWVPSSFVRDCYVQSGVDPEKVFVVPCGVNTAVFHPQATPVILPTRKGFKFLFVGGTLLRKGVDILLQAYLRFFSAKDDVCLVIKDLGAETFYRGQGLGAKVKELTERENAPEVLYLGGTFEEREMAGLYRACDCLVHPYRGEGFALPVAEAMACGLPVIVTNYGACLDFCDPGNALLVSASVVRDPRKRVGDFETVGYPCWAEPDVEHLAYLMRWVYENPAEARALGQRAAVAVSQKLTWNKAAEKAKARFTELMGERGRGLKMLQAEGNNLEELLEQGFQAYAIGDKGKALELFRQALVAAPDHVDVNYNLGLLYLERQEFALAARHLLSYLEKEVSSAEAWVALGSALAGLGDYGSAQIAYESALQLDSKAASVQENLRLVKAVSSREFDIWEDGWYRSQVTRLVRALPVSEGAPRDDQGGEPDFSLAEEEGELGRITAAVSHAFEAAPEFSRQVKEEILPFFRDCSRVLDVGCGEGVFLEMLREAGVEGEGIDLDPVVVEKARAKGLRAQVASALDFLRQHRGVYDGVMLGHIIEHFSGPEAVKLLYYCARALKGRGIIAIQTPNFSRPEVQAHNFWLDITHVRPYPPLLLEVILRTLRFDILKSGVVESSGGLDVIVVGRKQEVAVSRKEVVWRGWVYEASDSGEEARRFISVLNRSPWFTVRIIPEGVKKGAKGIFNPEGPWELKRSEPLFSSRETIVVHHLPVFSFDDKAFRGKTQGAINIGRTMFDLVPLNPEWVKGLNRLDEIWVPSRFNVETFNASGVDRARLRVVPRGVDPELFNPKAEPLDLRCGKGFVFLANFDFQDRKGWDILLTAYLTEFKEGEDVALLLRVWKPDHRRLGTIEMQLASFIRQRLGLRLDRIPEIILLKESIETNRMPGLYTACDAFVLPSRGEAWGQPYLEAMACGLPTIGTKWGGNLEFMTEENSFLIEIEGLEEVPDGVDVPLCRGHRWAKPSVEHLRKLMRYVFEEREEARRKGQRAREEVAEKWTWERAAQAALQELTKYTSVLG
ncbi:glycosyltransferase [Thermodesulfitimonas autotrophica]|uniref:glycosyltransferase n=1 Tax=Thermodesulfitimonas autotrophica TaxID=1894989 RepID=UPI0014739B24|nr:glycosyltransferase [Thermodesulfitimonas autotrophica]